MVGEIILAVLPSLVSTLTDHFLNQKRGNINLTDLQFQVGQLAMKQNELSAEAEHTHRAVRVLVRYLTMNEGETFLLRAGRLELTDGVAHKPDSDLARILQEFGTTVKGQIRQRQPEPQLRTYAPTHPPSGGTGAVRDDPLDAFDRFFDGFGEEIRQARLGNEAGPR